MDLYKTLKQHQQRVMRERGVIHEMIQFLTESLLYLGDMRRRYGTMLQQTLSEFRLIGGLRCQECTTADQGNLWELQTDTKLKFYKQRQIDCDPNNVEYRIDNDRDLVLTAFTSLVGVQSSPSYPWW